MNTATPRQYRYERKFLVDSLDAALVRLIVKRHPAMFIEAYPPRQVNNLYLDTDEMDNYHANLNGAAQRTKVRVRWYDQVFGSITSPVLEFKIKDGLVGTKESHPFPPFHLDDNFSRWYFQQQVGEAGLPDLVYHHLRTMHVVLCNHYQRWYYVTRDRRCRLTVDHRMTYYRVGTLYNIWMNRLDYDSHVIVELKYEKPFELQADKIAGFLPFRITRNSKYVTGIESVYP